jgi:RNA polymerase sigma-70 factor (ECF subfamily)
MNHNEPTASPVPPVNAEEEFTAFMRAYQDMVFATAVRLTANRAAAEDIAQEVFLRAHARFDQLRTSATIGGWLKTVATNLALNHLTRYRNRWRFFSELRREDTGEGPGPEVEFAAPDEPRAPVEAAERRARVEQALAALPDHQRVPLVLFHFEDLAYDEIATRLGVSLAKVKTDILRGRAALATLLRASGTVHDPFQP